MVVVIDDRQDVWGDCPNLVKVVPCKLFKYFGNTDMIELNELILYRRLFHRDRRYQLFLPSSHTGRTSHHPTKRILLLLIIITNTRRGSSGGDDIRRGWAALAKQVVG